MLLVIDPVKFFHATLKSFPLSSSDKTNSNTIAAGMSPARPRQGY
jgi:hypothetical protein